MGGDETTLEPQKDGTAAFVGFGWVCTLVAGADVVYFGPLPLIPSNLALLCLLDSWAFDFGVLTFSAASRFDFDDVPPLPCFAFLYFAVKVGLP